MKDGTLKRCTMCGRTLPERMFHWKIKASGIRMEMCKPCKADKQRKYRATPRGAELRRGYNKNYFSRHPEYLKEYKKARSGDGVRWHETPLGKLAADENRRKRNRDGRKRRDLLKRGVSKIDFTTSDWQRKLQEHPFCWICGKPKYDGSRGELTQDHLVPLSRGGTHTWDNIMPAHRACNSGKGASMLFDGRQMAIFQPEIPPTQKRGS